MDDGLDRTLAELGTDGAIVTKRYAEDNHLSVGAKLAVTTPAGQHAQLAVRGIYDPPAAAPLLGDISISQQTFDSGLHDARRTASRCSTRTPLRPRRSSPRPPASAT